MESITISKEAAKYLCESVIEINSYDGLDLRYEPDRKTARYLDELISALDMQADLDAQIKSEQEERRIFWAAEQARKAEEAKND